MAKIRPRKWKSPTGAKRECYIVDSRDLDGKIKGGFERKKDAERYLNELRDKVRRGVHIPESEAKTFGYACQAWLQDNERRWRVKDRMSGYAMKSYEASARLHVLPSIIKGKLLTDSDLVIRMQDVLDGAAKAGSTSVLKRMRDVMKLTMKFARRKGWILVNPLLEMPLTIPSREDQPVTPPPLEDIRKILDATADKENIWRAQDHSHANRYGIVRTALYTGARIGEVCALYWEDLDLENDVVHIRASESFWDGRKTTKSNRWRAVPMPEELKAVLLERAQFTEMSGYVFTTKTGRPVQPSRFSSAEWKRILRVAQLLDDDGSPKYGVHSLRHAYASILLSRGFPIWHVSKLLGHSSPEITNRRYGHLMPHDKTQRLAVSELGQMIHGRRLAPPAAVAETSEPGEIDYRPPERMRSEELKATAADLWRQGLTRNQIAECMGTTEGMVGFYLNGIASERQAKKLAKEALVQQAADLRASGKTYPQIAEHLGCTAGRVRHLLARGRELEMAPPARHLSPIKVSRDQLASAERIARAGELKSAGKSIAEIAAALNVTEGTVKGSLLPKARARGLAPPPQIGGVRPGGFGRRPKHDSEHDGTRMEHGTAN